MNEFHCPVPLETLVEQNGTTEEPIKIGIDSTTIKFASSDQEIQQETDPQVQNSTNKFTAVFE